LRGLVGACETSSIEAENRDVTHYCHFIAARQGKRSVVMYRFTKYTPFELLTVLLAARAVKCDSDFSGFAPRANLSHVNFLSDGTLEVVMVKWRSVSAKNCELHPG